MDDTSASRAETPASGVESAEDRYMPGDVIGDRYELVRRIGRGGMGEVWLANNRALDSRVAIKLVNAEVASMELPQAALPERLLREAQATAQLGHPAVVRVFDFGRTRYDDPMIVMEVLEGDSLATAMDSRRRPSPLRAVRLLLPIAHGLAAAHAKGVVHRDVKPDNILLCRTDSGGIQPKIIDFGIAKRITDQSGRLTLDGALLGSPDYMAPEQAKGQEATEKSDLWALATVLYELIAGNIPFGREDLHQQLRAIIMEDPEPLEGFEGAEALWPIIACALNKDPDARWESMRRFGKELALWAMDQRATDDISGVSLESAWLRDATDTDHVFTSIPPPPNSSSRADVERMPSRASDPGAVAPATGQSARRAATANETGGSAFSGPKVEAYEFEDPFIRERRRRYSMILLFAAVIAAGATVGVLIGAGIL